MCVCVREGAHGSHTVPLTGMIFFICIFLTAVRLIISAWVFFSFLHQENMHHLKVFFGEMVGVLKLTKP